MARQLTDPTRFRQTEQERIRQQLQQMGLTGQQLETAVRQATTRTAGGLGGLGGAIAGGAVYGGGGGMQIRGGTFQDPNPRTIRLGMRRTPTQVPPQLPEPQRGGRIGIAGSIRGGLPSQIAGGRRMQELPSGARAIGTDMGALTQDPRLLQQRMRGGLPRAQAQLGQAIEPTEVIPPGGQAGRFADYVPFLEAQQITQQRAAEDRARALGGIGGATEQALGQYTPAGGMLGQYQQALGTAYQGLGGGDAGGGFGQAQQMLGQYQGALGTAYQPAQEMLGQYRGAVGQAFDPAQQMLGQYQQGLGTAYQPAEEMLAEFRGMGQGQREQALAEMRAGTERAVGAYDPAQEMLQRLMGAPESIDVQREYAQARIPIEAQTQALARRTQEQYGGVPSGASLGAIRGIQEAGIGAAGQAMTGITLEATRRRRQDLLNAIGAAQGLGGAIGGIYERGAGNLAQMMGQFAGQRRQEALAGMGQARMLGGQQLAGGLAGAQLAGQLGGQRLSAMLGGVGQARGLAGQQLAGGLAGAQLAGSLAGQRGQLGLAQQQESRMLGGQRLSDILGGVGMAGQLGGQMGQIGMRGAETQAQLLGSTISAVPQVPGMAGYTPPVGQPSPVGLPQPTVQPQRRPVWGQDIRGLPGTKRTWRSSGVF